MNPLWLCLATLVSTTAGGVCALCLRERLHWVLGFSAGVLLGVVAFDLLPESLEHSRRLGDGGQMALGALVAGFVLFHGLKKLLSHSHHHTGDPSHGHRRVGVLSSLALAGHRVMDGVAVGLGFQVSAAVGAAVAVAVIAHDFCDGLNTVSLMLLYRHTRRNALRMLALGAVAPTLGAASTLLFTVPGALLAPYLGLLAGVVLHIGVSDILPQAHARAGPAATMNLAGLTGLGVLCMYAVQRWAG